MKKKPTPKPNPSNQFLLDPRALSCWEYYINPKSETYGNAYRSALKAKYAESTATRITHETWWQVKIRRMNLLAKSEKVLDEDLEMDTIVPVVGMFGPIVDKKTGKGMTKIDPDLRRIRQSAATFVTSRLGKTEGYSTRTELTGADGKDLPTPIYGGKSK